MCTQQVSWYFSVGTENDLNYFDIPVDVNGEPTRNAIDARHSPDESVSLLKYNEISCDSNHYNNYKLSMNMKTQVDNQFSLPLAAIRKKISFRLRKSIK